MAAGARCRHAGSDLDANGQPDLAYAQGELMRVLLDHLDRRRDHDAA